MEGVVGRTRAGAERAAAAIGDYTRLTHYLRIHLCMLLRIHLLCHCLLPALLSLRYLVCTTITSGCFLMRTLIMVVIFLTLQHMMVPAPYQAPRRLAPRTLLSLMRLSPLMMLIPQVTPQRIDRRMTSRPVYFSWLLLVSSTTHLTITPRSWPCRRSTWTCPRTSSSRK